MTPRLFLLALICAATAAQAQISVSLDIKRRMYLHYEPILATVHITNLSGRDLQLEDSGQPWFGFDVTGVNTETLVPPRNPDYKLDPLEIKIGETVKRTVDLTRLYGISEFGLHRIRATVFAKQLDKLFTSKPSVVDISEGHVFWKQTVGVPETMPNAGQPHTVELVEFQTDRRHLYVRMMDKEQGTVFCCYKIGNMIDATTPQMQFDTTNNLYVLHFLGQQTYQLTSIGVNGEFLGQYTYNAPKSKPYMRRLADGTVQLVGAHRQAAVAAGGPGGKNQGPKISDRPTGLPVD